MILLTRRLAPWLAVAILGLAIAACGGDDDEPSTSTGSTGSASTGAATGSGDGDWKGEFETGTDVTLTLWVHPSEPDLAEFEAFREATGANPVLYGRATATNDGSIQDSARFVTLTGADGETLDGSEIEVNFLCSHIARWIAAVATQTTELSGQYANLYNEDCGGTSLAGPSIGPGETVTYYVAIEAEPEPEFDRVFMGLGNELKR